MKLKLSFELRLDRKIKALVKTASVALIVTAIYLM